MRRSGLSPRSQQVGRLGGVVNQGKGRFNQAAQRNCSERRRQQPTPDVVWYAFGSCASTSPTRTAGRAMSSRDGGASKLRCEPRW